MSTRADLMFAASLAIAACSKSHDDPASAQTPGSDQVAIKAPDLSGSGSSARTPTMPSTDVRKLVGRMQFEAENRPKAGVVAEKLFDSLEANAGIKLDERRQYVGKTMHASFCAGGVSADHVTVAMCEYPDDKAAQESLDYMNAHFGTNGVRKMHHAAVMTIIDPKADDPRVDKAVQAFQAL